MLSSKGQIGSSRSSQRHLSLSFLIILLIIFVAFLVAIFSACKRNSNFSSPQSHSHRSREKYHPPQGGSVHSIPLSGTYVNDGDMSYDLRTGGDLLYSISGLRSKVQYALNVGAQRVPIMSDSRGEYLFLDPIPVFAFTTPFVLLTDYAGAIQGHYQYLTNQQRQTIRNTPVELTLGGLKWKISNDQIGRLGDSYVSA